MAQAGDNAFIGPVADQPGFLTISFSMAGQREMLRGLATWGADVSDMSEAWAEVGHRVLLPDFTRQFDDEGGWLGAQVGPPWAPLAESTIRDRAYQGYPPGPILERTSRLRQSVTEYGSPENIFEVTPTSLTVGTVNPYAVYHQWGAPRGHLPQRKMIGLRWESRSALLRVLNAFVRAKAIQAGLPFRGGAGGGTVIE